MDIFKVFRHGAAVVVCIAAMSFGLATAAQAGRAPAPFSTTASQRSVVSDTAPSCAYSSALLHFYYWGPAANTGLVWSSAGSASGNPVLLGNKKTSSPLDCFKVLGFGGGVDEFQQNNSSLCLNVAGNSKSAGAWIILYDCVSSANEKFRVDFLNGQTQIQSVSSGLCLDLGDGFHVLSHLEQKTCQSPSDTYQEWTYRTS
jgi:hypothetical protein